MKNSLPRARKSFVIALTIYGPGVNLRKAVLLDRGKSVVIRRRRGAVEVVQK